MRSILLLWALPILAALATGCETSPHARVAPDPTPKTTPLSQAPAAQATAQAPAAQATAAQARSKVSYGDPVSTKNQLVSLSDLLKNPSAYADKTIRTEGVVTAVCQGRGCWLELGDDRGMAHVKLGAHKFFVPKSSSGQHAVVEARVMPQVDKGHCEMEAEEQTGKVAKVELDASGVELSARE
jgi:hypothetical protein